MDFTIPEDLKMLQTLTRDFARNELLPLEKQVDDNGEFPEDIRLGLRKKAIELGLWNYSMPKEYGGGGVSNLGRVLVCEELGHVSFSVGYCGGIVGGPRSGIGKGGEFVHATQEQLDKYFLPMLRGEKECFMALTEANAGCDLGNVETRADKDGDKYILNGTKMYVTAIDISDFGLVLAVTDWEKRRKGGISTFLVDKDSPGLDVVRQIPLMGRWGLKSYEVKFDNCVVPAGNLFGEPGHGLEVAGAELASLRLECSSVALGTAARALEMAKSHAKQRVTFGEALARRQSIQSIIVRAETAIYASRLMLWEAAMEADQGKDIAVKAMMVKTFVTEAALHIVDRAIQVHGGLGYSRDLPLEMMYRDLRLYTIAEGATELMEWTIARNLLRD